MKKALLPKHNIHPYVIKAILNDKDPFRIVDDMVRKDDLKEWANTKDAPIPNFQPIHSGFLPSVRSRRAFLSIIFP